MHDLSVLIVEDDGPARLGLSLALETKVASLHAADNGVDGLTLYGRHSPDVVITDILMPRMNGLAMLRAIRESGGDPFVIVASGFTAEESYLEAIELGVNMFIKKPYMAADINGGLDRAAKDIQKRARDAYRSALAGGLLSHVPNCHLLTDGKTVLYFNDPKAILPDPAAEGDPLGPYLRANFTMASRHGASPVTLPQGIGVWLSRHKGREFILAATGQDGNPARFLLRLDQVRLDGRERHLLTFTDISLIEMERERFYQLAGRDFLTGVGNRQAFETELARETARAKRYGSELCLIMIDIDNFKAVNDTFGHPKGDEVLAGLARRVAESVRMTDVVCRYGGEEFMIIMPQTELEGALGCARKVGQAIASHDFGIGRPLTASIGVAQYQPGETGETLVRRVDTALYEAKNTGKNRVVLAQPAYFTRKEA
jgi:diguanylate cyclase (GGDEF)-like protein